MQTHFVIPFLAALCLSGCAGTIKSTAWHVAKSTPHAGPGELPHDKTFAKKLHERLQKAGVEHRVVTYKFRYHSRIFLNRETEETAVVYRDESTRSSPWWIMSERLSSPLWLPSSPLKSQVSFYLSLSPSCMWKNIASSTTGRGQGKDAKENQSPICTGKRDRLGPHRLVFTTSVAHPWAPAAGSFPGAPG